MNHLTWFFRVLLCVDSLGNILCSTMDDDNIQFLSNDRLNMIHNTLSGGSRMRFHSYVIMSAKSMISFLADFQAVVFGHWIVIHCYYSLKLLLCPFSLLC